MGVNGDQDFQPIFNIIYYCCQNALSRGSAPDPTGGGAYSAPDPQLGNVGSHPRRGPHRIAGPRAPRPHDPPLGQERNNCEHNTRKHGRSGQSKHAKYRSIA